MILRLLGQFQRIKISHLVTMFTESMNQAQNIRILVSILQLLGSVCEMLSHPARR